MSEPPDSTQSTTKREARGKAKTGGSESRGARGKTVAPDLDDETAAALTLYNTYLVADREQRAHERAVRKAEKAKDDAASTVRKLNDRKAPAAETAEAEAKYRDAAEALRRLRDGDTAAPEDSDEEAEDHPETPTDGADASAEQDAASAPDAAAGQDAAGAPDTAAGDASNSS